MILPPVRNTDGDSNEPRPTDAEESSDKFFKELLARSEKHRKEREAAGIPEFSVVNLHSSNVTSYLAKPQYLSGEEIKETVQE